MRDRAKELSVKAISDAGPLLLSPNLAGSQESMLQVLRLFDESFVIPSEQLNTQVVDQGPLLVHGCGTAALLTDLSRPVIVISGLA